MSNLFSAVGHWALIIVVILLVISHVLQALPRLPASWRGVGALPRQ